MAGSNKYSYYSNSLAAYKQQLSQDQPVEQIGLMPLLEQDRILKIIFSGSTENI
jgi:hypothetical protein